MRWLALGVIASVVTVTAACRQPPGVSIHTPLDETPEAHLSLTTTGHFASDSGGPVRLLAQFPLPGARRGKPFCTLYFRLPADRGVFAVGEGAAETQGLLIQHFGSLAGGLRLTDGYVSLAGVPLGGSRLRECRVAAKGADGTTVEGAFWVERSARAVARFETEFSPDVARLGTGPIAARQRLQADNHRPAAGEQGEP